jgi:DHA3 family macrolide efflux protein-like MFS transporter
MTARLDNPRNAPLAHLPEDALGGRWRLRFWSIFGGQALSLVGSSLTQFVLLWWITDTTGSVTALSAAGMAALLPQAVLGPLGGTLADRYSRRLLMITADVVSALCMLVLIALFLSERIELWHLYTLMAVRSAMQAFQAPAAAASVAMLVPRGFVVRAAGLNQSLQSLTLVASAPLGALAIGAMPIGWALSIDVFTALLGIVPLLCFRIPQTASHETRRSGLWNEFREGLYLVWYTPGLRQLYLLLATVVLAIMPTFVLAPLLVKVHFGGGASQVALMEGFAGGGMLLGGMLMAAMAPRRLVRWTLAGFAVSCASIALTAMAPASLFGVAVAWWVMSGISFVAGDAPLTALLQTTIPNQLQGRVLALMTTVMALAAPVGLALAVPLGEWIGIRGMFVVAGVLGAAASLAGFLAPDLLALEDQPDPDADRRS